ncbi:MAG TPA: TadE/TadG family type IV pilus assembly protein [Caulobacteraceae bacterium]|jgi:Flp pilus assembly protein TadG
MLDDRSGAGAVEFALVCPLLFALLFSALELGWAISCGSSVRSEVQSAARALMINPALSSADMQKRVEDRLKGLPIKGFVITVTDEWINGNARVKRVAWDYKYDMAMPLVPDVLFNFSSNIVVPTPTA